MNNIRKQLKELRKEIVTLTDFNKLKGAQDKIDIILDSLPQEPKEEPEEIPEGHLVACSDGNDALHNLGRYLRKRGEYHFAIQAFNDSAVTWENSAVTWENCKRVVILEQGETAIVFSKERMELQEGDKGYLVMLAGGVIQNRKAGCKSLMDETYACTPVIKWARWE